MERGRLKIVVQVNVNGKEVEVRGGGELRGKGIEADEGLYIVLLNKSERQERKGNVGELDGKKK